MDPYSKPYIEPSNPVPLLALGVAVVALIIGITLSTFQVSQGMKAKAKDQDSLSNMTWTANTMVAQRDHAYQFANHKQQFINEMFWHLGRFLTNNQVREITWNEHSISTFYDTNTTYSQRWVMLITPTNIIARKESDLEKPN